VGVEVGTKDGSLLTMTGDGVGFTVVKTFTEGTVEGSELFMKVGAAEGTNDTDDLKTKKNGTKILLFEILIACSTFLDLEYQF
jgi:hypothetical protein